MDSERSGQCWKCDIEGKDDEGKATPTGKPLALQIAAFSSDQSLCLFSTEKLGGDSHMLKLRLEACKTPFYAN